MRSAARGVPHRRQVGHVGGGPDEIAAIRKVEASESAALIGAALIGYERAEVSDVSMIPGVWRAIGTIWVSGTLAGAT